MSLALLSGFQDSIRRQMTERSAHLRVSPARGVTLPDAEAVRRALGGVPGVADVTDALEGGAWASDADGTTTSVPSAPQHGGAVAARVDRRREDLVRDWRAPARRRRRPRAALELAHAPLADRAGADLGRAAGPPGAAGRHAREKSADVEVSEETARTLSGLRSGAFALEAIRDPAEAESAARQLRAELPTAYRVETWRDRNAPLAFALRLEKVVIFVTVALVVLVAASTSSRTSR